jgi:tRNA uridine 5-carboxymethylaminomethyl modification enzyme
VLPAAATPKAFAQASQTRQTHEQALESAVTSHQFQVVVIGGGHAGVEAAWAAANMLPQPGSVALVTMDPAKIGEMSCNPAIGGLAKGQLVREIDAMGGLMGLATDATGIQFKMLNTSKGPAVHGPRAQCDKHAYARCVRAMIAERPQIVVIAGVVEELIVGAGAITAVRLRAGPEADGPEELRANAVVLTTGTFMRALMHTGETRTPGGRVGEGSAVGISAALRSLGFELGRLKTGTPPRLRRGSIDWEDLAQQPGDAEPLPFSDLSGSATSTGQLASAFPSLARFPALEQVSCRQTRTTRAAHDLIRANLHRAPMYSGQIDSVGPRYCPSIEDKVVRFADREEHGVFLEPESLETDWVYCNGISTSLPTDVQERIVRALPGCERAEILRYGYAVEYDMVRPHQITAGAQTKLVRGLYLAGQINGTSGYEEAAAQGLLAGLNAARHARGLDDVTLGRDQAYIGVLMDDLVTKTPVEPYRMFTSRAEHRLHLRADNAADRLTPLADQLGLLTGELGAMRRELFARRSGALREADAAVERITTPEGPLEKLLRSNAFGLEAFFAAMPGFEPGVLRTVYARRRYAAYVARQEAEIARSAEIEHKRLPADMDFSTLAHLRPEARQALHKFRPATFGQASRLEGITPADMTLLAVLVRQWRASRASA